MLLKDLNKLNQHILPQIFNITKLDRIKKNKHNSFVLWLVGLSGSGKSTLANEIQNYLFHQNINSYILDGDNIRNGINSDLDFTEYGRNENIRRVAEISKIMVDAGIIVIASFISPFEENRKLAKNIIGVENFIELYVECPIEVCEKRDVKGLYKKARNKDMQNFTGIDSPFDIPKNPDITVNTNNNTISACLNKILLVLNSKLITEEM